MHLDRREFRARKARAQEHPTTVIPEKAGTQGNKGRRSRPWLPAFAGMTG